MEMIYDDREPDVWVQPAEPGECRRHQCAQDGRKAAEAQSAATSLADLGDFLLSSVEPRQDAPRVPGQDRASLGEFDRSGATPHYSHPDFAFQSGDLLADR